MPAFPWKALSIAGVLNEKQSGLHSQTRLQPDGQALSVHGHLPTTVMVGGQLNTRFVISA